jgi:hypothetical protein
MQKSWYSETPAAENRRLPNDRRLANNRNRRNLAVGAQTGENQLSAHLSRLRQP